MYIIWHDNDYDLARWVYLNSDLSKNTDQVVLRPIPKTNSSKNLLDGLTGERDYHILPTIKYETPDIIIQKIDEKSEDSNVLFVTEFMTHTPQHHHPLQRFSRIYGASNLKIPSALIIPKTKVKLERKGNIYKPTSYKANPLIHHIFIKTSDVNNTPTLIFLWPDLDGYLKYDKEHPTAPLIDSQIRRWFAFLNASIRGVKKPLTARLQYLGMKKAAGQCIAMEHKKFISNWKSIYKITTMRIVKTKDAIREFKLNQKQLTPSFLKNGGTLIFEPDGLNSPSTPFRTDPYAGMLCAFDNLFCREDRGNRTLNLILRAKNINYTVSKSENIFVSLNHDKSTCPFLTRQGREVAEGHLRQDRCPFTRTKQQRIYGEVADIIVFDDYNYYQKVG